MQRYEDEYDAYMTDMAIAVLADPIRRAILDQLDTQKPNSIAYMRRTIPVTRQAMYKHLQFMVRAKIVIKLHLGRASIYYMDPRPIRKALASLGWRYKRDLRPLRHVYRFGSPHNQFD